ncbi:hypothetical protein C8R47DRAFT_598278 [Mycena vitilis]|nr:hypothetical protein C8R47DRAFT_598278 [Mycena vitilis]
MVHGGWMNQKSEIACEPCVLAMPQTKQNRGMHQTPQTPETPERVSAYTVCIFASANAESHANRALARRKHATEEWYCLRGSREGLDSTLQRRMSKLHRPLRIAEAWTHDRPNTDPSNEGIAKPDPSSTNWRIWRRSRPGPMIDPNPIPIGKGRGTASQGTRRALRPSFRLCRSLCERWRRPLTDNGRKSRILGSQICESARTQTNERTNASQARSSVSRPRSRIGTSLDFSTCTHNARRRPCPLPSVTCRRPAAEVRRIKASRGEDGEAS